MNWIQDFRSRKIFTNQYPVAIFYIICANHTVGSLSNSMRHQRKIHFSYSSQKRTNDVNNQGFNTICKKFTNQFFCGCCSSIVPRLSFLRRESVNLHLQGFGLYAFVYSEPILGLRYRKYTLIRIPQLWSRLPFFSFLTGTQLSDLRRECRIHREQEF